MQLAMKCQINNGGYLQLRSFTFFSLHDLYSGPSQTLLAGGCPNVVILAQPPLLHRSGLKWAK